MYRPWPRDKFWDEVPAKFTQYVVLFGLVRISSVNVLYLGPYVVFSIVVPSLTILLIGIL